MNVAFIPVRGGSKSIPLKNIKPINGKPLVYWTVKAACCCEKLDVVYVCTDSEKISNTVETFKVEEPEIFQKVKVIDRSAESATDTAPTMIAVMEFANKHDFDNLILIQATSPLLATDDLTRGLRALAEPDVDCVLSVVRQKRFNWAVGADGFAYPTNYDFTKRPRRQEFDGYFVENGAFYMLSKDNLLKYRNLLGGNVKIVEMSEDTFFEIDEPSDWVVIEALMKKNGITA